MYEYLDRRYAYALYEIAEEKGRVDDYLSDLKIVCDVIDENKDLQSVIKHPQISTKDKKNTFINIFKGNIDADLLSFLLILIEKDRIIYLREKFNEFEKIVLENKDIITGVVKTTHALSDEQYDKLILNLEKKYNKKVLLTEIVDERIIGGVYLKVNDQVIDGTLKTRIDELKKAMLSSKVEV